MAAKILIVDCNRRVRSTFLSQDYFKEFLEEKGFQVEIDATSKVLERIAGEKFDLLIIAIELFGTTINNEGDEVSCIRFENTEWYDTGLELLRRFRAGELSKETGTPSNIPVITISTLGEYPELACASFPKRFDLEQMLTAIHYLILK